MTPFPVTMILLFIESTIINILVPDLHLEGGNVPISFNSTTDTLLPRRECGPLGTMGRYIDLRSRRHYEG